MSTRAGVPEPKNLRNPGHFGPAVIGGSKPQQPTAAQLKVQPELAALERPEVADGEFEKEQAWTEIGAPFFGPAVIGDSEPQKPTPEQLKRQPELAKLHGMEAPKAAAAETRAQLPVEKLKEALEDNPFILDGLIAAEFERPEGPRKAAVRVLLKAEQEKAEPREDVVARLADAVKSGGVGGRSGTGPVPG